MGSGKKRVLTAREKTLHKERLQERLEEFECYRCPLRVGHILNLWDRSPEVLCQAYIMGGYRTMVYAPRRRGGRSTCWFNLQCASAKSTVDLTHGIVAAGAELSRKISHTWEEYMKEWWKRSHALIFLKDEVVPKSDTGE